MKTTVLKMRESSKLHRREMSQITAHREGWVPQNAIEHPEREGVACEIVRWENDRWRGKRAETQQWEDVPGPHVIGKGYDEVDRWITVVYRNTLG